MTKGARSLNAAVLCAVTLAVLLFATRSMADDKAQFQGDWLGRGCFGPGRPVALSYSVKGNTATIRDMIDNRGGFTIGIAAPATYRAVDGVMTLFSVHKDIHVDLQVPPDEPGRLVGSIDGIALKFSHGPNSDLQAFFNAYAHFCK